MLKFEPKIIQIILGRSARRPVGFIADVPGLQPSQLGVARAEAKLGHISQA